jgi:hypothetical protein
MREFLVSRHHEWREKVVYHGARGFRIERDPGVVACLDCGFEKPVGVRSASPCRRKLENVTSGYSGIVVSEDGKVLGRLRMAGRHALTGRPFMQDSRR